jgi:hypothetical protein
MLAGMADIGRNTPECRRNGSTALPASMAYTFGLAGSSVWFLGFAGIGHHLTSKGW